MIDFEFEFQYAEAKLPILRQVGCGKTTLTRLVNGLIPHFVKGVKVDGTVTVEDMKISDSPMYKIAESVGSVFQNSKTQFFNTDSSAEIAFGLENIGADRDSMHKRVAKTISDLGIETLADRSIFSLSGGEKQLLAVAKAAAQLRAAVFCAGVVIGTLHHIHMPDAVAGLQLFWGKARRRAKNAPGGFDKNAGNKAVKPRYVQQSPENHGRDRFPSSSCLRPCFHEALLFIPAVAVWAAGGERVLPHKVSRAARLAHGVVQTAQRGSEVI